MIGVQEPGVPEGDDPGTARAKMIKKKEDAWKLTPKRADRNRHAPVVESAPTQEVGAYEPDPDPAAGSARSMMIQKKQEAWKQPRRRR